MLAELLGKLGIDIKLLVAQIINFGLLVVILKKFLYGPVIKRIEEDEEKLKAAEQQKELLEKEKTEIASYKEKTITDAHQKAKKIIEEAEDVSKKIKEKYENEARIEKKKVINQINERLDEIKKENGKTK